ncbi:MAG: hypothetical protein M0D55_20500 [Elusimicrobiota bacterium]|nr:MAG: hypothetical protein M0D55_20500 [Elusimicrobiota bacterium]
MDNDKIGPLRNGARGVLRRKIVWQADAFAIIAPWEGKVERVPSAMVFDPHQPFILVSRVFPEAMSEAACLLAAVEEALFTYGVTPTEVQVRWGKGKRNRALEALAARTGFRLVLCDELRELAEVKADLGEFARSVLEA